MTSRRTVGEERWMDRSACGPVPANRVSDIFFPVAKNRGRPAEGATPPDIFAEARIICATCPVTADCLDYALRTRQTEGMWGGHDPDERAALRSTP